MAPPRPLAQRRERLGAGVEEVVAFFGALRRHRSIEVERRVEVNGRPAALLWFGRQYQLLAVDVRAGLVCEIHSIMNPDKLEYLSRQLAARRCSCGSRPGCLPPSAAGCPP